MSSPPTDGRRVLRVVQEYLPQVSGPANLIAGSSAGLARLGWQTEILTADLGLPGASPLEQIDDVLVRRLPAVGPVLSSYLSPELLRRVASSRADIVHIHAFRNLTADTAIVLARRRPVVFQPHGMMGGFRHMMGWIRSLPYRIHDAALGRRLVRIPRAVVASTKLERDECVAWGFPPERVVVIPEGVDAAYFDIPSRRVSSGPIRLLYVGRLSRDRNVEALIEALALVRQRGFDARLRIVGRTTQSSILNAKTSASSLHRLTRSLGLAAEVEFVGELKGRKLVEEFEAATVFVYAAQYDSFGQAIAQAAAAGLPIVTTPVGIATEIVRDGVTGWLSAPDSASFGLVLSRALGDRLALDRVGHTARSTATQFRWSHVAAAYAHLYRDLLTGRWASRPADQLSQPQTGPQTCTLRS